MFYSTVAPIKATLTSYSIGAICAAAFWLVSVSANPVHAGWFGPSNYDECLDEIVATIPNDDVARMVRNVCSSRFRGSPNNESYLDCILDHSEGLGSKVGFLAIRSACSSKSSGSATALQKCILKKMPGVLSDTAARAIRSQCSK